MNDELREEHFLRITDEKARHVYDCLCDACDRRPGGITDPDQLLICDVAFAEQIKQGLMDDVAARGVGQERWNGRQKYWQENKSLAQYRAFCDLQRKHLAELRLTPGGRKAAQVNIDDEFDAFE